MVSVRVTKTLSIIIQNVHKLLFVLPMTFTRIHGLYDDVVWPHTFVSKQPYKKSYRNPIKEVFSHYWSEHIGILSLKN